MNDRDALKRKLMERPRSGDEDYMTTVEIAREMGWSNIRTLERLHELKDAGELEVGSVERMNLAERAIRVPGYRLKRGAGTEAEIEGAT